MSGRRPVFKSTSSTAQAPAESKLHYAHCGRFQRHAAAAGDNGSQNKFNINLADGNSGGSRSQVSEDHVQ